MRNAAKVDRNHNEIRAALEKCGFWVRSSAGQGDGFPDLIAVHRPTGKTVMVEVKTQDGDFTDKQIRLMIGLVSPAYRVMLEPEQAAALAAELSEDRL